MAAKKDTTALAAICYDYAALAGDGTAFWIEDLNGGVVAESGGNRRGRATRSALMSAKQVRYAACALGGSANGMVPSFARACQRELDHLAPREPGNAQPSSAYELPPEVCGLVHDLNNLLGTISGNVELIGPVLEDTDQPREQLRRVARSCRLARLLVSRIASVGERRERASVDLGRLADEILELLTPRTPAGVRVECEHVPGTAVIEADTVAMEQLLLNLTLNALAAIRERGCLRIALSTRSVAGNGEAEVVLRVTDDGCGMDEPTLLRARSPESTPSRGVGMGLRLVTRIVSEHHGRIAFVSSPGRGTDIEVVFPVRASSNPPSHRETPAEQLHG